MAQSTIKIQPPDAAPQWFVDALHQVPQAVMREFFETNAADFVPVFAAIQANACCVDATEYAVASWFASCAIIVDGVNVNAGN